MRYYEATSTIEASPERVWEILTAGGDYPMWDSGVIRIDGEIAPGSRIKVLSALNPKRAFPAKVARFEPPRAMVWSGGMPLGLFKGVRTFTLTPGAGGTCTFHLREEFTGPMLPMIWRTMPDLGPSFIQFANGLKKRAEEG
jgi:hypothetical protein